MNTYLPPLSDAARRWVRFLAIVAVFFALGWVVWRLSAVFTPILAAFAIAYTLNPIVSWLERRHVRRLVTIIAIYIVATTAILSGLITLGTRTAAQVVDLKNEVESWERRTYRQERLASAESMPAMAYDTSSSATMPSSSAASQPTTHPSMHEWLYGKVIDYWRRAQPLAQQYGGSTVRTAISWILLSITSVTAIISLFVLVPMYTFFFLWKFNEIVRTIHDHLPAASRATIVEVITTIDAATSNFFRGRVIVCMIIGTLNGVGWELVGVRFGLLLGIFAGVCNLVPFLSLTALPPALLLAYFGAAETAAQLGQPVQWFWPVVLTMGVFVAVQAIESLVLSPTIEASSSGLHPITTVVALLIGAELAGVLGMLLAIPATGTIKALANRWLLPEIRRLAAVPAPSHGGAASDSGAMSGGAPDAKAEVAPASTPDSPSTTNAPDKNQRRRH